MSVATITSYLPLLNPSSASIRSRWVRLECKTATEWFPCFNLWAIRSAPCLVREKNERAIEVGPFEQRHQEVELLFSRDRINGVGHGFGRGTAHANFNQFRIAQDPRGEALDLRRQRCRKKKRLPIGRNFFDDATDIRQKSHVEHAIDFIEHENADLAQIHRPLLEQVEQPAGRSRENINAAFDFFALFAVTDAAVHDRRAQIGETAVIAERSLDLCGQFARWFKHETSERAVLREKVRIGKANAAVLPVPVWAVPIKSLPARMIGKARSWIGVGSVKPIACVPRTTSGESSKLLNDTV